MKNSILNLGKALNKTEQKNINGGYDIHYCDVEGIKTIVSYHVDTCRQCIKNYIIPGAPTFCYGNTCVQAC